MYCKILCVVAAAAVAFAVAQGGSVLAAGDVTAELDGSWPCITGDKADNEIAVYLDESGTVWLEGREDTTINGQTAPQPFTPGTSFAVFIDMGDGDDAVYMGPGAYCYEAWISTGAGRDEVVVQGASLSNLIVRTDDGNDEVKIEDVTTYDLHLSTGDGEDELVVRNTQMDIHGGGWGTIGTGRGHDHMVIDSIVGSFFQCSAGAGNDLVELRGNSAVYPSSMFPLSSSINLGDGNDVLDADASEGASLLVFDRLDVSGSKGNDTLINPAYFQPTGPFVELRISGFEVTDKP